jgi:RES domain-containing protein
VIFDAQIIDFFETCKALQFDGEVFRATRKNLDPLAPSVAGGRWMIPQRSAVLYTCTTRPGAIAEIQFHWGLLTPIPSKPAMVHKIAIATRNSVRITSAQLADLDIDSKKFAGRDYTRCQEIGAAAAFMGFDGLLVPSARSSAENLVILHENHNPELDLRLIGSDETVLSFLP